MDSKIRRPNADGGRRWFSTGFMVGGIGSVDPAKHVLRDAVLVRPGEAQGHGMWIDSDFCSDIAGRVATVGDKGLKARFGHPNMCSEALGTFLGRWKWPRVNDAGKVLADLFLSSVAAESPKGDLRNYVEQMAAKEPQHFGASLVFTIDWEAMDAFLLANGATEKQDEIGPYIDASSFRSPDPNNVKNLPHARCAELHAADLVDDPAATDGMFSGVAGRSLAAQMTEWLDTHPEVLRAINDEPELLNIVTRYADELQPFLMRYTENQLRKGPAKQEETPKMNAPEVKNLTQPPAAEPAATPTTAKAPAETAAQAQVTESPAALAVDSAKEIERLTGELAGTMQRADTAEAQVKALTAERDELAARATKAEAERDAAQQKLRAIEAGAPPVSAAPAPKPEEMSPWKKAQASAPSRKQ